MIWLLNDITHPPCLGFGKTKRRLPPVSREKDAFVLISRNIRTSLCVISSILTETYRYYLGLSDLSRNYFLNLAYFFSENENGGSVIAKNDGYIRRCTGE